MEQQGPRDLIDANPGYVGDFYQAIWSFVTSEAYQNFIDPALPNWPTAYYGESLPRLT
jgi:hypothetical protein